MPHPWPVTSVPEPFPIPVRVLSRARRPVTIIHHLARRTTPDVVSTIPYYAPPWESHHKWGDRVRVLVPEPVKDASTTFIDDVLRPKLDRFATHPSWMWAYTDGSRLKHERVPRAGAGACVYLAGSLLLERSWGLGRQSEVFDAEMFALAAAAANVSDLLRTRPHVTRVVFASDNRAAVESILDLRPHDCQMHSIIFSKKLTEMLESRPDLRVELVWIPGHAGFLGNEVVDRLAKRGASSPACHPPSLVWAKGTARKRALYKWRRDFRRDAHPSEFRAAVTTEPLLMLHRYFKENEDTRNVECRLVQLLLGHGHVGSYYHRFVAEESTQCQCRTANIQTREHLLVHCPLYTPNRHHFGNPTRPIRLKRLFASKHARRKLAAFLTETDAFTKPSLVPRDPG